MTKKKTFEEVRAAFNQRGFTLLSKDYQDVKTPLDYLCSNNHNATIRYGNLQSGKGCLECSGSKKKTFEEVRKLFTARGFKLLSTEYKGAHSNLEYFCNQGHKSKISFNKLKNGRGCAECGGTKKKTIEEVRLEFNQRGFTLLSTVYKGNKSPLTYICGKGHQTKISFDHLHRGNGCSSCANHGFNPNKPATLYYLRFQFTGNFYYKIGITNRTILERFQSEKIPYKIIKETDFALGKSARDKEQAILKEFSASRYKGKPFLTDGNTELFSRDVLQLDYETIQNLAA